MSHKINALAKQESCYQLAENGVLSQLSRAQRPDYATKILWGWSVRVVKDLGMVNSQQRWDGADRSERRTMIGDELRAIEEEKRMARAVAMKTQGAWLNWEDVVSWNISWNMLWKIEPLRIRFLIRATYDLLQTPTNLVKWGITESEKCLLCDRPCSLEHI